MGSPHPGSPWDPPTGWLPLLTARRIRLHLLPRPPWIPLVPKFLEPTYFLDHFRARFQGIWPPSSMALNGTVALFEGDYVI